MVSIEVNYFGAVCIGSCGDVYEMIITCSRLRAGRSALMMQMCFDDGKGVVFKNVSQVGKGLLLFSWYHFSFENAHFSC